MYAIVEIAGQQFKVEEGKKIFVHRLEVEAGQDVEFKNVLLIEDEGKVVIGEPVIKDALIEGKVLEQVRGDKVIVFKKKRKKGLRVKNGHRQYFTQVEIINISEKGEKKAKTETAAKKPAAKKPAAETEATEAPVKKATKKTEAVKAEKEKPAAKKTAKAKKE
jgi:large subunit ribosomal protein L21